MARQAEKVIVLTESGKFERHGTVPLNIGDRIRTVITDENMGEKTAADLRAAGTEILYV